MFMPPPLLLLLAPLAQDPAPTPTWTGTFLPAPSDARSVELWPQAWSGGWTLLEVAAHGSFVHEGQVIARFDPRGLTEAVEAGERALEQARTDHRAAVARAELEAQGDAERLATAVSGLARARRAFQGWREIELPMRRQGATLQDLFAEHGIKDAEDELAQLEAMYTADELADATEELVLMRNRRNLARTRTQLELARRQRAYTEEYAWAAEDQEKEETLQRQEAGLERLRATLELDAAARRERLARAEAALTRQERDLQRLKEDAQLLELRAPREGMLVHGSVEDYGVGRTPPRHSRGGSATPRTPLFAVIGGARYVVSLEVSEADRATLAPGAAVEVSSAALPDFLRSGRLEVQAHPLPRGGGTIYAATVELEADLRGVAPGMRAMVKLTPQ